MPSLGFLLDTPVTFQDAPDLFCLDLYKLFDLDQLAAMAGPASVIVERYVEEHKKQSSPRWALSRITSTIALLYY